ncbi:FHA domain-containing protein DDL isoform X2 [Populus nigra]|uniref:FHA domain-containing protein DDL isoform X2 n=1 Tax=Populus nigra TaxID=3691 RepID=UPI002B26CDF8|nr:FHA domain-containing protein DDL isoform X2 [Populus nigra]
MKGVLEREAIRVCKRREKLRGIVEKEERGKLGRREGQRGMRLKESLLLEEDIRGGLLHHWNQTVATGASMGLDRRCLKQRETAMRCLGTNSRGAEQRNSDDDNYDDSVAKMKAAEEALEVKKKQEPSFELSGKLAAETNRVRGVTLLFTEPPDAKKPNVRWRLYVFKGGEALNEPLYIHRQSCYLFGRERRVADIPTDHPSCSKQHAVIQFRQVEKEQPDGMLKKQVRPYVMDLGSTNKTFINDNPIEPQRYYELFEKDTIKFGNSSREYVLLHENSSE